MHPPFPIAPETVKLFLALLPGHEVSASLSNFTAQWHWPAGAVPYAPQDWHMTLHFLGTVASQQVDVLRAGLDVSFTPFALRLGQAELWPHGLAVLCPDDVPDALLQLHARLGRALQALNLKTDARPYRPHVTLARHAQGVGVPLQKPVFVWPVAGYALMASTGRAAERYDVLQRYGTTPSS
jgi:2'-5' RNA ligase